MTQKVTDDPTPQYTLFAWHSIGLSREPYGTLSMERTQGRDEARITVGKPEFVTPAMLTEFEQARDQHRKEWAEREQAYRNIHRHKPPANFFPRFSIIAFFERKFPLTD